MQKIFSEFPSTSATDWKNQLVKDLKGEPFESLVWQNENGFDIEPFYTAEDLKQTIEPAFTHADWEICVDGKSTNSATLNSEFLNNLQRGASSISLRCEGIDLEIALKGVQLNYIQSTFYVNDNTTAALKKYLEKHYTLSEINCSIFPETFLTEKDLQITHLLFDLFGTYKNIKIVAVDVLAFHNKNCNAYYEVALIMSALVEKLEVASNDAKLPVSKFVVKTGVNEDYFVQIAKLRAIRRLWNVIRKEYNCHNELYLIIETSLTDKSISDSYNNLIRTTVESMAAVAGGCNELIVTEFDVLFSQNKNLAERMAVNQQLILKEESYLNKMADIACGSYYIESITDAISNKALETFKQFEADGGFLKCIEKNDFTSDISAQAKHYANIVESKKHVIIGVNKFKNEKEHITLSSKQIEELKLLGINNPGLKFELENYLIKK